MNDIIARIKHKLAYLQQHDDGNVMGATHERERQVELNHLYELQAPHSEEEILAFEVKHKIRLPEDYRLFLLQVGSSGVGPGYGIDSPISQMGTLDEIATLHEQDDLSDDEAYILDALPLIDLNRPFPFEEATTEAFEFLTEQDLEEEDKYRGQIFLSDHGCNICHSLIITGKCRGEMWSSEGDNFTPIFIMIERGFELNPEDQAHFTPDTRVSFTQWYEAWLNRQIRIVQEHWRKQGRDVPPLVMD